MTIIAKGNVRGTGTFPASPLGGNTEGIHQVAEGIETNKASVVPENGMIFVDNGIDDTVSHAPDILSEVMVTDPNEPICLLPNQRQVAVFNPRNPTTTGVIDIQPNLPSPEDAERFVDKIVDTLESVYISPDDILNLATEQRHALISVLNNITEYNYNGLQRSFGDPFSQIDERVEKIRECAQSYMRAYDIITNTDMREADGSSPLQLRNIFANIRMLYNFTKQTIGDRWGVDIGGIIQTQTELVHYEASPELANSIRELAINALKYSPDGTRRDVSFSRVQDGIEDMLEVTVFDRGIGIPQGDVSSIFQPEYRASNAAELTSNGTGHGLSKVVADLPVGGSLTVVTNDPKTGHRYEYQLTRISTQELAVSTRPIDKPNPYGFVTEMKLSVPYVSPDP